jgi:urease accessory protein
MGIPTIRITTTMRIPGMDEGLYTLCAWLSPGYPVGAFGYSHGIEWAVEAGDIRDTETLALWIADLLRHGSGRTDAVLLAHAWRAERDGDRQALAALAELAEALAPSAERLLETTALGTAFAKITESAWGEDPAPAPYPVALGQAAARRHIPLDRTTFLYLHAFAANLVSAAIRLVPLGQTDGQRALAELMPEAARAAAEAVAAPIEAVGGCAIRADIASMRHETQRTRLFRS